MTCLLQQFRPSAWPDQEELRAELGWIAAWKAERSLLALDRLLRKHAAGLRAMARRWAREAHRQEDLVSEGNLTLIACLDGYVPVEGVPFFAYARPFVRAAMRRALRRDAAAVDIPSHHLRAAWEGQRTGDELSLLLAATRPQRIDDLQEWELGADEGTAEAAMIREEEERARSALLDGALAALTQTERLLVERRRSASEVPLSELAKSIGMGQDQARRIEGRALARMREHLIRQGVGSSRPGGEP